MLGVKKSAENQLGQTDKWEHWDLNPDKRVSPTG